MVNGFGLPGGPDARGSRGDSGLRRGSALAVILLGVVGCQAVAKPLPPVPPEVEVVMDEMSFSHPEVVESGRTVFDVRNAGNKQHRLILVPLPEDFPPIQEQILGSQRRRVVPVASIPDLPPGRELRVAVDLVAGRYALVCMHVDADGVTHAEKGMTSEFRVPDSRTTPGGVSGTVDEAQ